MSSAAVIHIVDDDDALRTALARLLGASGFSVRSYASGQDLLAALPLAPGCILLDVDMPDLNGMQLQTELNARANVLPIVFLTGNGTIALSVKAIKAGAEDFLSKPIGRAELLDAVARALLRGAAAQAGFDRADALRRRAASLTAREQEVFGLVIQGLLNKQVAHALGNTERTVKAHRHSLMEKMGAGSLAELVQMGSELGILKERPSG